MKKVSAFCHFQQLMGTFELVGPLVNELRIDDFELGFGASRKFAPGCLQRFADPALRDRAISVQHPMQIQPENFTDVADTPALDDEVAAQDTATAVH